MYSVVCGLNCFNFVPLAIRLPLLGGIILPYLLHYDYLTLRYPTKGYPLFLGAFYLLVAFLASFINWVFYAIIELLMNYSWEYIMTLYNLAVLWFIMWLLFGSYARIGVRLTLWLLVHMIIIRSLRLIVISLISDGLSSYWGLRFVIYLDRDYYLC
jgi:hypothetical protein